MSSISKNLGLFKADFISENSRKPFRTKVGEWGECFISVINFVELKTT
jgi:hypothetical protein